MTALKVIGIILLIFLLIGFLRVGALLRFGQELNLRLSRPAGKVDLFACPYLRRLKAPKDPNGRE